MVANSLEAQRKQTAKIIDEYVKQQSIKDKAWFDSMQQSDEATKAIRLESDELVFQASILGMSDKERRKAIASRKIELELVKEKAAIESNKNLTPEQRAEQIGEATQRAADKAANLNTEMAILFKTEKVEGYGRIFENVFSGMADAIVDFAKTGKLNFNSLIESMLSDLLRFELRQQMMQAYQATGGGANIITSIIGAFSGGATPSAKGNVFNGGLQAFAKGGSFTNGIVNSPTMFNMGVMGEAGPEAIMPLRRGSDGSLGVAASGSSGGNVSVQVINNSSAQATTNETTDSKGNRKIEVVIGEMTAGEISRSGSSSQKSIKSTFGIQPQLIRR
jgi:hypothetical protein